MESYAAITFPSLSNPDALWCDRCGAGIDDPTGLCPACGANPATGEAHCEGCDQDDATARPRAEWPERGNPVLCDDCVMVARVDGFDDVPHTSRHICSWCKADLGSSPTDGDSHGICAECSEAYFPTA
jgi:hypothetical protein